MDIRSVLTTLQNHRKTLVVALVIGAMVATVADLCVHARYIASASVLMVASGNDNDGAPTTMKPLQSDDLPTLAQTGTVLGGVANTMGGSVDPGALSRLIRADVYQNSNVMTIRFTGSSPEQAVTGANAVADQIVGYYRTLATQRFDSLAVDIRRQLSERQQQLQTMDTKLQTLTAAYPYLQEGTGTSDATSMNARLIQLQAQRNDLAAALLGDQAQASITADRLSEVTPLARKQEASDDPVYRSALEQYSKDVAQLRNEQTKFTPAYPGIISLKDAVQHEEASLSADKRRLASQPLSGTQQYADVLAEVNRSQSLVASDQAKLQQVDKTIVELQSELRQSSSRGTAVEALRRERASAQNAYQQLSARLSTVLADRAAAASTGSLIVLDRATGASRSPYTRPSVITTAIMLIALWVAITLAFILEALYRRFRTLAIIEAVYGAPVLGSMLMLRTANSVPRSLMRNRLAIQSAIRRAPT